MPELANAGIRQDDFDRVHLPPYVRVVHHVPLAVLKDRVKPPKEEPEPPRASPRTAWRPRPSEAGQKAPKAKPNNGGKIDAGEALEFLGDFLNDFLR